jgi:hypothetical protein
MDLSSNWKGSGGFVYENQIREKLNLKSLLLKDKFDDEDAIISYNGVVTRLEIKSDKNAIFGQIKLNHNGKNWVINDKTRNSYPNTVSLLEHEYEILHKVNSYFRKPTGEYKKDLSAGNLSFKVPGTDAIKSFYHLDKDTHYIQIGGSGFYVLGEDVLSLKSSPFHGNTVIRVRYKKYRKEYYGAVINFSVRDLTRSIHDLDSQT